MGDGILALNDCENKIMGIIRLFCHALAQSGCGMFSSAQTKITEKEPLAEKMVAQSKNLAQLDRSHIKSSCL